MLIIPIIIFSPVRHMAKKILIIGSGAAGMTAASTARKFNAGHDITVITEDEDIAYSPVRFPGCWKGKTVGTAL